MSLAVVGEEFQFSAQTDALTCSYPSAEPDVDDIVIVQVGTYDYPSALLEVYDPDMVYFTQYADVQNGADRLTSFWHRLDGAPGFGQITAVVTGAGSSGWMDISILLYRGGLLVGDPINDYDLAIRTDANVPVVTTTPTVTNTIIDWHKYVFQAASFHGTPTGFTTEHDYDTGHRATKAQAAAGGVTITGGSDDGGTSTRLVTASVITSEPGGAPPLSTAGFLQSEGYGLLRLESNLGVLLI